MYLEAKASKNAQSSFVNICRNCFIGAKLQAMATMDNSPPEPETDGVNAALERVRALESRIRQAIQMNNRDLERPPEVVDRERSALDSIE